MGHKIMHALFNNLGLKIVSLVIAFVIWLLVSNADNPTRTYPMRTTRPEPFCIRMCRSRS